MITLFFLLLISSCSSKEELAKQGEQLFNEKHLGKNKVIGCILCHATDSNTVIIGPSLVGISIRAPYLVENQSGREYIKSAIINPDAYIVEGFLPATMYSHYSRELSSKEVDALVEFLLQL